jgi:hypothetical protein
VDWIEVGGAALRPRAGTAARALVLLLGIPFLAGAAARAPTSGLAVGALLAWSAAAAAWIEPFGALLAVSAAALPALLAAAAVWAACAVLRRFWADHLDRRALLLPVAAVTAWLALASHPFYFYPDVETHGRMLRALAADPVLLVDPSQPWERRGDVTREFGGRRVAIPYTLFFHALAWPFAPWLGEAPALKTVAVAALGITLLLVFPLARAAGLPAAPAFLAQALAAALPVSTARVSLALYPTLLGQAAVVLLLVHLARRLGHLVGARDAAAATAFLLLAQVVYTGSLVVVAAFVLVLAALEALAGDRKRTWRLVGAWGTATALVLAQYAGFLPVLWRDVLPHLGGGAAPAERANALALGAERLGVFFDTIFPALAVGGVFALRVADVHARRVLVAGLIAGTALAVLRFVAPSLLRDAKEVELLVAPVAVTAAAALAWAWARGGAGRAAALLAASGAIAWGAWRSAQFYADRFWAAGR